MKHLTLFPNKIYKDGGYYDEPETRDDCFDISSLSPSPVNFISEIYPSVEVERPPYAIFGGDEGFPDEVRSLHQAVERQYRNMPSSIFVSIEKCYVFKNVIYRLANEGLDVIHETYRKGDRPWTQTLDFANNVISPSREYKSNEKPCIYLGSVGSSNYGHWLVDDLARVKAAIDNPSRYRFLLQSHNKKIDDVRLDSMFHVMGPDIDIEIFGHEEIVYFEKLHYVTPISIHPVLKHPEALNFVRATADVYKHRIESASKNIFVKRSDDRYRRLINSPAIEALLIERGFEIVNPEMHNFSEQVSIFANAEIVVGIMCAAMTNTVFCGESCSVVYLSPTGWLEPFYWDLATALKHKYTAIYGKTEGIAKEPHLDDFSVEPHLVLQALESL